MITARPAAGSHPASTSARTTSRSNTFGSSGSPRHSTSARTPAVDPASTRAASQDLPRPAAPSTSTTAGGCAISSPTRATSDSLSTVDYFFSLRAPISAALVQVPPLISLVARNLRYRPVFAAKLTSFSPLSAAKFPVATAWPQLVPSVLT